MIPRLGMLFRSIFVVDNHQPFYPSSNSLRKQQLISGSSVHLQITTLGPTSSFTVIIDLRMYVFLTQEIQVRLEISNIFCKLGS